MKVLAYRWVKRNPVGNVYESSGWQMTLQDTLFDKIDAMVSDRTIGLLNHDEIEVRGSSEEWGVVLTVGAARTFLAHPGKLEHWFDRKLQEVLK